MAEKRKRRIWSNDEKCRIVAQTLVPGISVSQVARRYDVNANLVFKWVRDPRFCPTVSSEPIEPTFLPVEVSQSAPLLAPERTCSEVPGTIKISLANGHCLEISGDYYPDVVVRLARGLAT